MRRPTFRLSCSHETWIKVFPCDPPLSRRLNSRCLNITRGPAHSLACPSCCNDGPDPAVYMLVGAPQVRHKLTLRMIKVSAMSIWVSWFHGSPLWTVKPVLSSTEWITTATFGISRFCALPLGETHQGSCPIPVALGDITDPQLHDWLEAGKSGWRGGSEAEQKKQKTKNPCLPRHPGPSYTRPHATLCDQAMPFKPPLGQTKTSFRPVPNVIVRSRSNLFLLAARSFSLQLCWFCPTPRQIPLFGFWAGPCPSSKGQEGWFERTSVLQTEVHGRRPLREKLINMIWHWQVRFWHFCQKSLFFFLLLIGLLQ